MQVVIIAQIEPHQFSLLVGIGQPGAQRARIVEGRILTVGEQEPVTRTDNVSDPERL